MPIDALPVEGAIGVAMNTEDELKTQAQVGW